MHNVVDRIADVSASFAAKANVGACETAGMIVSVLRAHPDLLPEFLERGEALLIDDDRFRWEHGALSWHAGSDGRVVQPSELRAHLGRRDV